MSTDLEQVRFPPGSSFRADLQRRVSDYFEGSARSRHGGWAMAAKTAFMLAWLAGSYLLLLFAPLRAWQAVLLSVSVGLAMAGVGFCVMHDANHGGTSSNARLNGVMSFTLDLLGASSFLWRFKHNALHHAYPNVSGLDPDIEAGSPLLRLAPWQTRRGHHRFQHLYVWLLYGIFPLGNVLAAVFQLAHCVDEADFLHDRRVETDWAEHQTATTVDFARDNALLGWYLGGLNFQVEHHLFPRVCHVHYPALSRIVEETCRTHRIRYRCEPTLGSALAANWRWLRRMGSPIGDGEPQPV